MSSSFSIIIPHRDCPELLQRCLDSIPKQENIQIIVVDDNSDPLVVDFNYFPGYDRDDVKVIFTKEGKGAGYARNVGLEYAIGEWVIFADADDFFFTQGLSRLLEMDFPEDASVVLYQYKFCREDGSYYIYPEDAATDNPDRLWNVCLEPNILCRKAVTPWAKMVRREHLNKHQIRFDEVKWGNDVMYSTRLSLSVSSFLIVPILVYSYEWHPNSLVNKDLGINMFYSRALLSLQRASLLQRGGRLNYNVFADLYFTKVYSTSFYYSVLLRIRCVLQLGLRYCIVNWRQFTRRPLYLTRLLIKRLVRK